MKFNKLKRGFTLVEILLAVGIIGVALGGLYSIYKITASSNDALQETSRLMTYAQTVNSIAETNGNFSNINIDLIEDYGVNVDTRFGLTEIVSNNPNELSFVYEGIGSDVCTKFANNVLTADSGLRILINGTEIVQKGNNINPIAQIAENCTDRESRIEFIQNKLLTTNTLTNEASVPAYSYDAGNVGSLGGTPLNPLTNVPVAAANTYTQIGFGSGGGVGFVGVPGFGGVVTLPPNTSTGSETPPISAGSDAPSPEVTLPENASIDTANISYWVKDWNLINVFADNYNLTASNLLPGKEYFIVVASTGYNLLSNNPVTLGQDPEEVDELSRTVSSDSNGDLIFNAGSRIDISDLFRAVTGLTPEGAVIKNSNEPMNAALKDYIMNNLVNQNVAFDLIDKESGKPVATAEITPRILYYIRMKTETETRSCPADQLGSITVRRDVEVWSDGVDRNPTAWVTSSNTCYTPPPPPPPEPPAPTYTTKSLSFNKVCHNDPGNSISVCEQISGTFTFLAPIQDRNTVLNFAQQYHTRCKNSIKSSIHISLYSNDKRGVTYSGGYVENVQTGLEKNVLNIFIDC